MPSPNSPGGSDVSASALPVSRSRRAMRDRRYWPVPSYRWPSYQNRPWAKQRGAWGQVRPMPYPQRSPAAGGAAGPGAAAGGGGGGDSGRVGKGGDGGDDVVGW